MDVCARDLFLQIDCLLQNSADFDIVLQADVFTKLVSLTQLQPVTASEISILLQLMSLSHAVIAKPIIKNAEVACISDLVRCLRNSIGCRRSDLNSVSSDLFSLMSNMLLLLRARRKHLVENEVVLLRCCLQVFGNLACQNEEMKSQTWQLFWKESLFKMFLNDIDQKIQEFTMMILYNCTFPEFLDEIVSSDRGHEVLILLTNTLNENVIDWGVLFLEHALTNEKFMSDCYSLLPVKSRLSVLDIIAESLRNCSDNDCAMLRSTLKYIKQHFVEYVMDIMRTCDSSSGDQATVEILRLLSILCDASVSHVSDIVKTYSDLLETAIDCLKSVHLLGKKSCNSFSAVSSLREAHDLSEEEIQEHPSFGFKKNLIRLIGNMCSECELNQDLLRKLDGIQLLLDCCNLDARNPYIMQWCILAIRNLMENNSENQKVLAEMTVSEELANSSQLLKELGLTVVMQEGRPVLKSQNPNQRT